jgi:peptide/nickel transport system ATP-binding protein
MKQNKPLTTEPVLQIDDLVVEYAAGRNRKVHAVSGVSFNIGRGETFGLVGESGCGKSSVAKAIMQLPPPTSGRILLNGADLTILNRHELRACRQKFQMVFQDPISSLNPRSKIGRSIEATLRPIKTIDKDQRHKRVRQILDSVGLDPKQYYDRLPFQLSGGQCQRVSIARALISNPQLLICDEPVSSLDVSVQAQIINLLRDLKTTYGLSMLFISHDLAVVKNICDRVAVMYLGHLCEIAPSEKLYSKPFHPYTRALLSAIPQPDPQLLPPSVNILPGELPSATDPPSGCRFRTRCPRAQAECALSVPPLRELHTGHQVACHYPHFNEDKEIDKPTYATKPVLPRVVGVQG